MSNPCSAKPPPGSGVEPPLMTPSHGDAMQTDNVKTCRGCGAVEPLNEFYRHAAMADGHLNFCKLCVKNRVLRYRADNIERIREYDRERGQLAHRKEASKQRSRKAHYEHHRHRRGPNHTLIRSAHSKTWAAIRSGILPRLLACEWCDTVGPVDAHHEDYRLPLNVIWLCEPCHGTRHRQINELIRRGVDLSSRGFVR
jgi:hypothetical protein